ncbi:MAG: hypothetical protein ABR555_18870, partial [Pyrinomonadaceae bacterium]
MSDKKSIVNALLIMSAVLVVGAISLPTQAQDSPAAKPAAKKRANTGGRDPFKKYEPQVVVKKVNGQIVPPPIAERIE